MNFLSFLLFCFGFCLSFSLEGEETTRGTGGGGAHQSQSSLSISQFAHLQLKLKSIKHEIETIYLQMKNEVGESDAMRHMIESIDQAEDSLKDVVENLKNTSSPLVGSQAKQHIVREAVSSILQFIGLYGLTVTFASFLYYCISGILLSGGFLTASLAFLPALFSSSIIFPPVLLLIEAFFGLSFIVGSLSWLGLSTTIDSFGYFLLHPQALEKIGAITLIIGILSSFLQTHKRYRY